jgi:hypothetical protein
MVSDARSSDVVYYVFYDRVLDDGVEPVEVNMINKCAHCGKDLKGIFWTIQNEDGLLCSAVCAILEEEE